MKYITLVMDVFGFAIDYSYYIIVKYEKKLKTHDHEQGSKQMKGTDIGFCFSK